MARGHQDLDLSGQPALILRTEITYWAAPDDPPLTRAQVAAILDAGLPPRPYDPMVGPALLLVERKEVGVKKHAPAGWVKAEFAIATTPEQGHGVPGEHRLTYWTPREADGVGCSARIADLTHIWRVSIDGPPCPWSCIVTLADGRSCGDPSHILRPHQFLQLDFQPVRGK